MKDLMPENVDSGTKMNPRVIAVCVSPGGVPKPLVDSAEVTPVGLVGDGHDHEKHVQPHRAVLIQDIELLNEIKAEGYPVGPGIMGENLTVQDLNVQRLAPGDKLLFEDGPVLELSEPRRPCFVLKEVHADLEEAVVGRCGFLARVEQTGRFHPGQRITVQAKAT